MEALKNGCYVGVAITFFLFGGGGGGGVATLHYFQVAITFGEPLL